MSDDFGKWQKEHTPDRKDIGVCFNRELLYEYEQAAAKVAAIKSATKGELAKEGLPAAEARLEELAGQIKAAQRILVFQSIGTHRWRDLLSEHPPQADYRNVVTTLGLPMEFNPDTFVPVAMSESCVEPGMSLEQAEWFCSTFPVSEVDRVFGAVLTCNVTGLERPFDDGGQALHGAKK